MNRLYNILNALSVKDTQTFSGAKAVKRGMCVTVMFENAIPTSTSTRTVLGTLPSAWAPTGTVIVQNISGTGYGYIGTNGSVEVFGGSVKSRVDCIATYVL